MSSRSLAISTSFLPRLERMAATRLDLKCVFDAPRVQTRNVRASRVDRMCAWRTASCTSPAEAP